MIDFLNIDYLIRCGRYLRDHHQDGKPHVDYIAVGMATEYLRGVVGLDWTNQVVFRQHRSVARANRDGRTFMRAEADSEHDQYRSQERALWLAEMLFNLQGTDGIEHRVEDLQAGKLESTYAELECGSFLLRRDVNFRYIVPHGQRGLDYDADIPLPDGGRVNIEMKCKVENTALSEGAVKNALHQARKQLPSGEPGLVFLKIPEVWVQQPAVATIVPSAIDAVLRGTTRIVGVIVRWEEVHVASQDDGAAVLYRYRLERGARPHAVTAHVEGLLASLDNPGQGQWVSFHQIAARIFAETQKTA